jgi:hypothetical protein
MITQRCQALLRIDVACRAGLRWEGRITCITTAFLTPVVPWAAPGASDSRTDHTTSLSACRAALTKRGRTPTGEGQASSMVRGGSLTGG